MKKLNHQEQILAASKALNYKVKEILNAFDLDYEIVNNRLSLPCPVHGGDNSSACTIYLNENNPRWICWSKDCQSEFGSNIFGLLKGIITNRSSSKVVTNQKIYQYAEKILNCKIENLPKVRSIQPHERYLKKMKIFTAKVEIEPSKFQIRKTIVPSRYYLRRGFSEDVLNKFYVGDYLNDGMMKDRAIVPIFDNNNVYLGSTARDMSNNSKKKWINDIGLKKTNILYGLNLSKNTILKSKEIIIVEGPGDVWKMHEAGFENTVAIMGSNLSNSQLILLEKSGAHNIVVLTDFDEAGEKAYKQIIEKGGRRFNYFRPKETEEYKDVGDMPIDLVKKLLEKKEW